MLQSGCDRLGVTWWDVVVVGYKKGVKKLQPFYGQKKFMFFS